MSLISSSNSTSFGKSFALNIISSKIPCISSFFPNFFSKSSLLLFLLSFLIISYMSNISLSLINFSSMKKSSFLFSAKSNNWIYLVSRVSFLSSFFFSFSISSFFVLLSTPFLSYWIPVISSNFLV